MIKPLQSITLTNDNGEDTTYVVATAPAIVETTEPAGVASFSDGAEGIPVTSLIADITPVQNLNGQSAPYPAGGGKNMLNVTESGVTSSQRCTMTGTEGNLTFTSTGNYGRVGFSISNLTVGNTYTFSCKAQKTVTSGKPSIIYLGTSDWTYNIGSLNVSPNGGRDTGDEVSLTKTFTATDSTFFFGVYVTADTGSGDVVKIKDAMLESGGSVTAYAPYSNICPITGWTGMALTRTGKNLFIPYLQRTSHNGVDFTLTADGEFHAQGTALAAVYSGGNLAFDDCPRKLPAGTYRVTVSGMSATSNTDAYIDFGMVTKDGTQTAYALRNSGRTYIVTEEVGLWFWIYVKSGISIDETVHIQVESGSTSTDFELANGTTYPISWSDEAGTVYGGTLDVTTGLLTVDRVIEEYDGTENWAKSSTYNGSFYLNTGTQHSVTNYPICSHATYDITFPSGYTFGQFGFDGTGKVNLNVWIAAAGTSLNDFKAYLAAQNTAGTPLQVVTYLATPQTYQLTPQAVLTILGQNNIWADTGDVEVAYCADTKMYIDKVIAAL